VSVSAKGKPRSRDGDPAPGNVDHREQALILQMQADMHITDPEFKLAVAPTLSDHEVQLWRVDLEKVSGSHNRWQKLLSPDEQARAQSFRISADRQRYTVVRALLRVILAGYMKRDPEDLTFAYSNLGKPRSDSVCSESEIRFNVSHSGGAALLAFTRAREVGVDIEIVRHNIEAESLARRFFSLREQEQLSDLETEERAEAFFRCWTRKEAYLKATGAGLSLPLGQFDVSIKAGGTDCLLETRPDATEADRWSLREVPAGPGYVGALCISGQDWELRSW
jgi:4'-phosphopantetheinyl transferase